MKKEQNPDVLGYVPKQSRTRLKKKWKRKNK